jgi:putative toxin-antitoxin system antitoxin component (TIGR02293 family)
MATAIAKKTASQLLLDFPQAYRAEPLQRIAAIKEGVQAGHLGQLSEAMDRSQEWLLRLLDLPRATVTRKMRAGQALTSDQSERVLGLSRLVGQVAHMVQESGDPSAFDPATWTAYWLEQANPALGNHYPAEFMDTLAGQEMVAGLLRQMQSGAYA